MSFLFVDKIVALVPRISICGYKSITANDIYLSCNGRNERAHFLPTLIGETLGQLAAWNIMSAYDFTVRPVAGVVASARFLRNAYVGETLILEAIIDNIDDQAVQYHATARVADEVLVSLEGAIGPLLPMREFIAIHEVKRQFDSIYQTKKNPDFELQQRTPITFGFDHIYEFEPWAMLSAHKQVADEDTYFIDHFPLRPVLPMTILLECIVNLVYEFIERSNSTVMYKLIELRKIKMNEFINPKDIIVTHLKVKALDNRQLILSCYSEVNNKRVCIVEVVMEGC